MSVDISGTDRSRSLHGSPSSFHHPYHHHHNHQLTPTDLMESMEKRTQRTYRYGIALVCMGAGLNWLGFAQVRIKKLIFWNYDSKMDFSRLVN